MKVIPTELKEVLLIEPDRFEDHRGFFMESYNLDRYARYGIDVAFVQDNLSCSVAGTIRGLHYQYPHTQEKLVWVAMGEVYDVVVDVRAGSPTFGRWVGIALSAQNGRQVFVPKGFAHGFKVVSDRAVFVYKCGDYYHSEADRTVLWSDPDLGIDWGIKAPLLSEKDASAPPLKEIPRECLPAYGNLR